jgi:hypothetical protein
LNNSKSLVYHVKIITLPPITTMENRSSSLVRAKAEIFLIQCVASTRTLGLVSRAVVLFTSLLMPRISIPCSGLAPHLQRGFQTTSRISFKRRWA